MQKRLSILLQRKKIRTFRSTLSLLFTAAMVFFYIQLIRNNPERSEISVIATVTLIWFVISTHIHSLGNKIRRLNENEVQVYTQVGFFKFSRLKFSKSEIKSVELGQDAKENFVASIKLNNGKFILIDRDRSREVIETIIDEISFLVS